MNIQFPTHKPVIRMTKPAVRFGQDDQKPPKGPDAPDFSKILEELLKAKAGKKVPSLPNASQVTPAKIQKILEKLQENAGKLAGGSVQDVVETMNKTLEDVTKILNEDNTPPSAPDAPQGSDSSDKPDDKDSN